jgi:hypothetical protein
MHRGFKAFGLAVTTLASIAIADMRAADAADLCSDCCADLEERIAELEATAGARATARCRSPSPAT